MADNYAICLLAGGLARRMGGGDKGELEINGQTIMATMIAQFSNAPYLFINANGDLSRFAHYHLPVISDLLPDHQGPLSGIYAALRHLKAQKPEIDWLLTLPNDAPLLPAHLADDLAQFAHKTRAPIVSVKSHGRTHPVIGLWSVAIVDALEEALTQQGVRKIDAFTAAHNCQYLCYDETPDPFLNLNRPDDLAAFHSLANVK